MLMHAIAQGAVRTPWESLHRQSILGEKSLAVPETGTHVSTAPGFSVGLSTNWATPPPITVLDLDQGHRAN